MELKRKSILLIMAFLIGCDLCACGKEDSVVGESLVEDTEEVSSTEETKSADRKSTRLNSSHTLASRMPSSA